MKLLKRSLKMMVTSIGVIMAHGSSVSMQVNTPEWVMWTALGMFFSSFFMMAVASIKYNNEINQWFYLVTVRLNKWLGLPSGLTAKQHKENRKN